MADTPERVAAKVRAAILSDLERIEAYHRQRMEAHRAAGAWDRADQEERMAGVVRANLVTAQAAATRAIEEAMR